MESQYVPYIQFLPLPTTKEKKEKGRYTMENFEAHNYKIFDYLDKTNICIKK